MSLTAFIGAMELGLVYSLLAFGTFISFRILKVADLTVDGSFVLGAAASAMLTFEGMPFAGILAALTAGAIAGVITALLQTKMGIQPILAGILTMTGLYSINLRIMMGKANLPLLNQESIFTDKNILLMLCIITFICAAFFTLLFKTKLGYLLKGIGDNENMITSLGINTGSIKIFALSLSNAFIALSGGILAQYQGFSDINMGTGTMIMGLASIIIGYNIFRKINLSNSSIFCIIGTLLYRTSIALSLRFGFNPSDLNLISSIIVIIALSIGNSRELLANRRRYSLGKEKFKYLLGLKKAGSRNA